MVESPIDAGTIVALTLRLTQILAEEVDYLQAMRVKEVAALQKEKEGLILALERYKEEIVTNPEVVESFTEEEKSDITKIWSVLSIVMEENRRELLLAKEVNKLMVEAIAEVAREQPKATLYDKHGETEGDDAAAPITLDERI